MSKNEIIDGLKFQAARRCLGIDAKREIIMATNQLLDSGVYFDEFFGIIDPSGYEADFEKAVNSSMSVLGVHSINDRDSALWLVLTTYIEEIALAKVDPINTLKAMMSDVYYLDELSVVKTYVGDSHGLEHLVGLYWGWDDMVERPTEITCNGKSGSEGFDEIRAEVIKYAKEWLRQHPKSENAT